jgi:hypothetical protein
LDLVVGEREELVVGESGAEERVRQALVSVPVRKLGDLVQADVVSSREALDMLISNAKVATEQSLNRISTSGGANVDVTGRPDLGRYGSYIGRTPGKNAAEAEQVWSLIRRMEPSEVLQLTPDSRIQAPDRIGFVYDDITVKSGGRLRLKDMDFLKCRHLIIERRATIIVQGAVHIKAESIEGRHA